MKIVFATSNPNKVKEIKGILGDQLDIRSLADIDWTAPIEEVENTLEGNAVLKARTIADHLEIDCFAEDTGLEIDALEGRPGVYSARYSGEEATSERNIDKVLEELGDNPNRGAQFRTVIALAIDDSIKCFEGIVRGRISHRREGSGGFGYDPVFIPEGHEVSFGEMSEEEKNKISHRARATAQFSEYLKQYVKHKSPKLQQPQK